MWLISFGRSRPRTNRGSQVDQRAFVTSRPNQQRDASRRADQLKQHRDLPGIGHAMIRVIEIRQKSPTRIQATVSNPTMHASCGIDQEGYCQTFVIWRGIIEEAKWTSAI